MPSVAYFRIFAKIVQGKRKIKRISSFFFSTPVLVDFFAEWCGPCKMMSSKVFPDKQAGDFFNPRFISLKIDMEKGEGKELAQKWNISAFPTYLILNPQGEVVYTSRGYIPVEELIKRMNEGLEQWKNNIKTGK